MTQPIPEPIKGMIFYDVAFPQNRWMVGAVDGDKIHGVRTVPDDGTTYQWDRAGWDYAWDHGWLALDESGDA